MPNLTADEWNRLHPVGTPVVAYPGCRPSCAAGGPRLETTTRSAAWHLGHGELVVMVDGYAGGISTDHVIIRQPAGDHAMTEPLDLDAIQARTDAVTDPASCGTCRRLTAAGQPAEHPECARRATLLPAPDAPCYETILDVPENERAQLPARFHTPVYDDLGKPKSWKCAVCWGDGWSTAWPCETATEHGRDVFTPEHLAERVQADTPKLLAEIRRLRAENEHYADTTRRLHAAWHSARRRAKIHAAESAMWSRTVTATEQDRDRAIEDNEQFRAELAKYVGHEPTIAEELVLTHPVTHMWQPSEVRGVERCAHPGCHVRRVPAMETAVIAPAAESGA